MIKISVNSFSALYPKNQNFLEKPVAKNLALTFIELPKEKKRFYFKYYKKMVKIKIRKNKIVSKTASKFILDNKLQKLNYKLTNKKLNNLNFFKSNLNYKNLKTPQLRARNLKGYSQYSDKIFSYE
jgi:hypothetical protein